MDAAAYCTIIKPLFIPLSVVKNGVRPLDNEALTILSMRRSEILANSEQAIPKKSNGRAIGSP